MQVNTYYNKSTLYFSSGYYTKEARRVLNRNSLNISDLIFENADDVLSKKSKKLIAAMNTEIEEMWAAIKKGKTHEAEPIFHAVSRGKTVTVKPIYGGNKPSIMMEIDNGKYIEKIVFDRKNPQEYRYEKVIQTDNGSATVKSFNSQNKNDSFIMQSVNEMVEKYIPKILSKNVRSDYFGKFYEF